MTWPYRNPPLSRSWVSIAAACAALFALGLLGSACSEFHRGNGAADTPDASTHANANQCSDAAQPTRCHDLCTSLLSDPANCGACGRWCSADRECRKGQCECAEQRTECGGSCVDLTLDAKNCGRCGNTCAATERCGQGVCVRSDVACGSNCAGGPVCAVGQTSCGGQCVDTRITAAHCGGCGHACGLGQLCQVGRCTCPPGLTPCDNGCFDLQTDTKHCGQCTQACTDPETCSAGVCGGAWRDGCTESAAHDIELQSVSVAQAVEIPVMQQGQAVPSSARSADIVQSKSAVFRGFVDVGAAFAARDISARLLLRNGATTDRYFEKKRIARASSEPDPTSTFQLSVPADKVQADTQYSLALVECAAASGTQRTTRFPSVAETPLQARHLGSIKITLVPVQVNGLLPDLSDATLSQYRAYLEAVYPVERAELRVGTQIDASFPINWITLLEQIRIQRKADQAEDNEYYFGMVQPTATRKAYCQHGCAAGIGYVSPETQAATRAAVGLSYADEASAETLAHELGHNLGRGHAPCATGAIAGVDTSFPYDGAKLGTWGYDPRHASFFDPGKTFDIMSYCEPRWVSDYTYAAMAARIAAVNTGEGTHESDLRPLALYRVLIVDAQGPRWSQPFTKPDMPFGTPEDANVLDIDGNRIATVTVYRTQLADETGSTILVPEPEQGWNAIQVNDAVALSFAAPVSVPSSR